MELPTSIVSVKLPNGAVLLVEATQRTAEQDAAGRAELWHNLNEVIPAIEGLAGMLMSTLQKVRPTKASVELGLELAVEPGKLTAMLVKGSGKANLKITLEWGGEGHQPKSDEAVTIPAETRGLHKTN